MLNSLTKKEDLFHSEIPKLPSGKYVHIILLRKTESFPLFQTDGELNTARVSKGLKNKDNFSRVVMFKRKQSSPERLKGRELLRGYGVVSACEYNSEKFCKKCPDCINYGFAIGSQGSEKSKVIVDSCYSISGYDVSHQQITFNGLSEWGTMTKEDGGTKDAFNQQDHIIPQVFFPSIVTIKDPTETSFLYVFSSILKTKRYGAQNTRTGSIDNILVGVVFSDSEIFSNLKLSQSIYDILEEKNQLAFPLAQENVFLATNTALSELIKDEFTNIKLSLFGENVQALKDEVNNICSNDELYKKLLTSANEEAKKYALTYGVDKPKEKKEDKKSKK